MLATYAFIINYKPFLILGRFAKYNIMLFIRYLNENFQVISPNFPLKMVRATCYFVLIVLRQIAQFRYQNYTKCFRSALLCQPNSPSDFYNQLKQLVSTVAEAVVYAAPALLFSAHESPLRTLLYFYHVRWMDRQVTADGTRSRAIVVM